MASSWAPTRLRIVDTAGEADNREEFRHRMKINLLAAAAVAVLLAIGVWLAGEMMQSQRAQGCYASGSHTCSLL